MRRHVRLWDGAGGFEPSDGLPFFSFSFQSLAEDGDKRSPLPCISSQLPEHVSLVFLVHSTDRVALRAAESGRLRRRTVCTVDNNVLVYVQAMCLIFIFVIVIVVVVVVEVDSDSDSDSDPDPDTDPPYHLRVQSMQ